MIWGIGVAFFVGALSYRLHLLSLGGSLAAVILAVPIFGFGGWMWAMPMLAFFLLSSLLSKVGGTKKEQYDQVFEKGGRRDGYQVFANGGVAGLIVVIYALTGRLDLFPIYCAALAAAAADTWATELGTLAKGTPRLLTTFRKVPAGTSGGVTVTGLISAAAGAMTVSLSGWVFYGSLYTVLWVAMCGVLGSVLDSVLGATLQAQYRCDACGKVTEKHEHCDQKTRQISGWSWMNNDWVNGLSIAGGAFFAFCTQFLSGF
jgi:uncharacterized protein (TIGR00297 family)